MSAVWVPEWEPLLLMLTVPMVQLMRLRSPLGAPAPDATTTMEQISCHATRWSDSAGITEGHTRAHCPTDGLAVAAGQWTRERKRVCVREARKSPSKRASCLIITEAQRTWKRWTLQSMHTYLLARRDHKHKKADFMRISAHVCGVLQPGNGHMSLGQWRQTAPRGSKKKNRKEKIDKVKLVVLVVSTRPKRENERKR